MKKIVALILSIALLICALPFGALTASAESYEEGYYTYSVWNDEATITRTKWDISGDIIIPSTLGGYPVTAIGNEAFYNRGHFTSVVIPEGVTNIGRWAFSTCENLKSITLPNSLIKIQSGAFANCVNLESITITKNVLTIEVPFVHGDESLISITVDSENPNYCAVDGVLFNKDKSILLSYPGGKADTTYTIPDGVEKIQQNAFSFLPNLKNVNIPSSVEKIVMPTFNASYSLESINVSDSNSKFSSENGVLFDKDKKYLLYYPCSKGDLTYAIPNTVNEINNTAFYNCQYLENIIINEGVTSLFYGSFDFCEKIKSVVIPSSMEYIDEVFYRCTSLTDVYYYGSEADKANIDIESANKWLLNATWHYNYDPNRNGWALENGKWAYYENGAKVTNSWIEDSQGWCYLDENGYCATNCWKKDSSGWCYLDSNGRMVTNAWVEDSQGWCYIGADGYAVTNCWKQDSVGWCYLDSNGSMVKNSWINDGTGWYYLNGDGYMVSNCWMQDSNGWCYLGSSGRMATNQWIKDSVGWCYVGADGYCVTNCWMQDSIGWCYLDAEGRMVTNAWVSDANGSCWLDSNGYWNGVYA